MPIGDEIETFMGGIGLQADPVLEGAEIVTDMEAAGGAYAGEDAVDGGGQVGWTSMSWNDRANLEE